MLAIDWVLIMLLLLLLVVLLLRSLLLIKGFTPIPHIYHEEYNPLISNFIN